MEKDRYRRQILVKEFGQKGQKLLTSTHVTLIGGGGLGSNSANLLVRMGIGNLDIIDYDKIDTTNLHRTTIFSEKDIGKHKALVLKEKLQLVNSNVKITAVIKKVTSKNVDSLIHSTDLIIDGTDNMSLRFLINEKSVEHDIPWVYAGVYGTVGMVMAILPKKTACFRCITPRIPGSNTQEIPVLGTLPSVISSIQCNEAIKIILSKQPSGLLIYDVWNQCFDVLDIKRNPYCSLCGKK